MAGPLKGLRIIEMAGIGPGPFACMMLADHGAEVIRVERPGARVAGIDPLARSRKSITVDMKAKDGAEIVRQLARNADGFIEGFRPGVAERMGLGPDVLLKDNPRLVYGRMTGWGQHGPYAALAGHDINYIAVSGVLHTVGVAGGKPVPPVNYVGDFGGGAMMMAFGMVAAMLAAQRTGQGDVIDCAMTDGSALLSAMTWFTYHAGMTVDRPGLSMLDGGAHFYDTYETADGKYISLGAIEPQFYALMLKGLGLEQDPAFKAQQDRDAWPDLKARVAALVKQRTRDQWCEILEGDDACFAPVMSLVEAPQHPHNVARETFITVGGVTQPAPAPRYTRQALDTPKAATEAGVDTDEVLAACGFEPQRIADLRKSGALG